MKIGNEVSFHLKQSPRGTIATNLRYVDSLRKKTTTMLSGCIIREADQGRGAFGLLEVKPKEGISVPVLAPFLHTDGIDSSRKLCKGDDVEFTLHSIPDTSYNRAIQIKVIKSKREKIAEEQLAVFKTQGAPLGQGHVESVRGDYGYIRNADCSDQQVVANSSL